MARDAAAHGAARDDEVLRWRTATRDGHVDWTHDGINYPHTEDAVNVHDISSQVCMTTSWRAGAADAVAAAHHDRVSANQKTERQFEQENFAPPSRAALLSLVSRLQDQVTVARERQDELSACLRSARTSAPSACEPPTAALPTTTERNLRELLMWQQQQLDSRRRHDAERAEQRAEFERLLAHRRATPAWLLPPAAATDSAAPANNPVDRMDWESEYDSVAAAPIGATVGAPIHAQVDHAFGRGAAAVHLAGHPTSTSTTTAPTEAVEAVEAAKRASTGNAPLPLSADSLPSSPQSAVVANRHRTRFAPPASPGASTALPQVAGVGGAAAHRCTTAVEGGGGEDDGGAFSHAFPRAGGGAATAAAEAHISRLQSELAAARAAVDAAEARARASASAQAEAERAAAEAARSASASSAAAATLREQLAAVRKEIGSQLEAAGASVRQSGRDRIERAELEGVKAQLRAKWEEAERLRVEVSGLKSQLARREALYQRRELEMRGVRARALAMVQALRAATESLGREHKSAYAILEGQFRMLEEQVHLSDAADHAEEPGRQ